MKFKKNQIVEVHPDWQDKGKMACVLGPSVFVQQLWTPVMFEDKEAPEFFKTAGLILAR